MSVFVSRSFNIPVLDSKMIYLSWKNFSDETMKKVNWVTKMFCGWHQYRHNSGLHFFHCDLDRVETISQESVLFAMCRFSSKVKKNEGSLSQAYNFT